MTKRVQTEEENLDIFFSDSKNFNDFSRKNVTFDNFNSHKKPGDLPWRYS